jgi:hypothetical protein
MLYLCKLLKQVYTSVYDMSFSVLWTQHMLTKWLSQLMLPKWIFQIMLPKWLSQIMLPTWLPQIMLPIWLYQIMLPKWLPQIMLPKWLSQMLSKVLSKMLSKMLCPRSKGLWTWSEGHPSQPAKYFHFLLQLYLCRVSVFSTICQDLFAINY